MKLYFNSNAVQHETEKAFLIKLPKTELKMSINVEFYKELNKKVRALDVALHDVRESLQHFMQAVHMSTFVAQNKTKSLAKKAVKNAIEKVKIVLDAKAHIDTTFNMKLHVLLVIKDALGKNSSYACEIESMRIEYYKELQLLYKYINSTL